MNQDVFVGHKPSRVTEILSAQRQWSPPLRSVHLQKARHVLHKIPSYRAPPLDIVGRVHSCRVSPVPCIRKFLRAGRIRFVRCPSRRTRFSLPTRDSLWHRTIPLNTTTCAVLPFKSRFDVRNENLPRNEPLHPPLMSSLYLSNNSFLQIHIHLDLPHTCLVKAAFDWHIERRQFSM